MHAWEKYGLEKAQAEFWEKYYTKHRFNTNEDYFPVIIRNRIEFIGFVRGKDDQIYLKFLKQLASLAPNLVDISQIDLALEQQQKYDTNIQLTEATIYTEGKTDIKHIKAAWKSLQCDKKYNFKLSYREDLYDQQQGKGSSELLTMCK